MLTDKVCVVTGSGSGIGRATAVEMGAQGAKVVVTDVNDEQGAETVGLVEATGAEAIYIHCDVRSEDEIVALIDGAVERFGGLDVLHNNAGVHETDFVAEPAVDTLPLDVWTKVYEINLRGVWLATKHAAPHLRASERGPGDRQRGVDRRPRRLPDGLRVLLHQGRRSSSSRRPRRSTSRPIRCNCYSPGSIDTAMIRKYIDAADDKQAIMRALTGSHLIQRLGEPGEVAKLVCFLASEDASFITGSAFTIDGGSMAWRGSHA